MIRAHIGEKPLHTHENIGLEDFLERLQSRWGGSEEIITVIAHASWNGIEIDAVVLLPRAIAVLDFKSHRGRIRISENGPWVGEGGVIKGGSKLNPFAQIRDNKRAVMSWLGDKNLLPACNLAHVSGAVVFSGSVSIEGDLGPKIGSWFFATDLDRCVEILASLASPQIRVDIKQSESIVAALGVQPYQSTRSSSQAVSIDGESKAVTRRPPMTEKQQEVLGSIARFLQDDDRKSLSVLGMTNTGKTSLLCEALREVERGGRQAIILAPNIRIAKRLSSQWGWGCTSIYSHMYGGENSSTEDPAEEGLKKRGRIIPLRTCRDPVDAVYLIDEAHLIGNEYFESDDGTRFGSGRLADDFRLFGNLGASSRQIVLFGDPCQLPRGRKESMPLFGELQRTWGLATTEVSLSEMFDNHERAVPLRNARYLAQAILTRNFSELNLETGPGFAIMSRHVAAAEASSSFQDQLTDCWYITDTHSKALTFNRWVRGELFKEDATSPIMPGDLLEFYNVAEDIADPFVAASRVLTSGDRLVVESVAPSHPQSQSLKGREEPIRLTTRRVEARSAGVQQSLIVLEDFLLAERPELDPESAVALNIWQAKHPDQPVSRLRYGYATTGHHAQGLNQPVCFVDAGFDGGRHSETYFRWLYTAVTRASRSCAVLNFRAIDPFDEAQWIDGGAKAVESLPLGGGWQFSADGPVSTSLPMALTANAGTPASSELKILEQRVRRLTEPLGWYVTAIQSHAYQEQFQLKGPGGTEVKLFVSYKQGSQVTGMRVSDPVIGNTLLVAVAESAAMTSLNDEHGSRILRSLRTRIGKTKLRVGGAARDGEYRLSAALVADDGGRAQVEINHDKNGIVSAVRLIKFVGSSIASTLRDSLAGKPESA